LHGLGQSGDDAGPATVAAVGGEIGEHDGQHLTRVAVVGPVTAAAGAGALL